MAPAPQSNPLPLRQVAFGPFLLDIRAGELFRRGKKIKVQQLPLQVLAALVEQPGEVIPREELRARLWPVDTFVDFEHGLNTAIKKLRTALGETSVKPRYIETLPKKGYRFLGKIVSTAAPGPPAARGASPDHHGPDRRGSHPNGPNPSGIEGQLFRVNTSQEVECVVAPTDAATRQEWLRLRSLGDDVGVSMMIAHNRLLLVEVRKLVRVLSVFENGDWCEVRVLEGEHYGKVALLPRSLLSGDSAETPS